MNNQLGQSRLSNMNNQQVRYNLPNLRDEQLRNDRFVIDGLFYDPQVYLFDTLFNLPDKFLRDSRQVIKTYSRLVRVPYPYLNLDHYKSMITNFAIELTLAKNAPNARYSINHLTQCDVAAMAKLAAVSICNDTTFFLHAVHFALMKFIGGQYGSKANLYVRLQDKWGQLPMSASRQFIHQLHSQDGGIECPGEEFNQDDEWSVQTTDPVDNDPSLAERSTDSLNEEFGYMEDNDNFGLKTHPYEEIEPYHIKDRILIETRLIWERDTIHAFNQSVPNYVHNAELANVEEAVINDGEPKPKKLKASKLKPKPSKRG